MKSSAIIVFRLLISTSTRVSVESQKGHPLFARKIEMKGRTRSQDTTQPIDIARSFTYLENAVVPVVDLSRRDTSKAGSGDQEASESVSRLTSVSSEIVGCENEKKARRVESCYSFCL